MALRYATCAVNRDAGPFLISLIRKKAGINENQIDVTQACQIVLNFNMKHKKINCHL